MCPRTCDKYSRDMTDQRDPPKEISAEALAGFR
jgi:hypothetical protein